MPAKCSWCDQERNLLEFPPGALACACTHCVKRFEASEDLLAACKEAAEWLCKHSSDDEQMNAQRMCIEAIAKAEGGET